MAEQMMSAEAADFGPLKSSSPASAPQKDANLFTISRLLNSTNNVDQKISATEANTLLAMRDRIDERLRHCESETPKAPTVSTPSAPIGPMGFPFMNPLYFWNALRMAQTESGNRGSTEASPQQLLHPTSSASNHSDERMSRESSNVSPNASEETDHCDEDSSGLGISGGGVRKKKTRTVFSRKQVGTLESAFNSQRYLSSGQRSELANQLGLSETQVKIWFQNRRNKWKRQSHGEEIHPTLIRSPNSTNGIPNSGFGEDAVRLLLQQNPPAFGSHLMGPSGFPPLPPFFSSSHEAAADPRTPQSPAFEQIARLLASNFLSNSMFSSANQTSLIQKTEENKETAEMSKPPDWSEN